jgi:hypothetical protein
MTKSPKNGPSTESPLPDLPDPRRLHEATDSLNAVLLEAQQALADLNLGVTAFVLLEEGEESGWYKSLGLVKVGREFKLVIFEAERGDEENGSTTELIHASRESRLQAVTALPRLYEQLVQVFKVEVARVMDSISTVQKLTQAIRAKAGK